MEEALAETRRVERDEAVKQKKVKRARFLPEKRPVSLPSSPTQPYLLNLESGNHSPRASFVCTPPCPPSLVHG